VSGKAITKGVFERVQLVRSPAFTVWYCLAYCPATRRSRDGSGVRNENGALVTGSPAAFRPPRCSCDWGRAAFLFMAGSMAIPLTA